MSKVLRLDGGQLWSGRNAQPQDAPAAGFGLEHANTRETALAELSLIAKVAEPAFARTDGARVID